MLLRLAALVTLAVSAFCLHRAAQPIFDQNARVRQWPAVDATVEVTAPAVAPLPGAGRRPPVDPANDGRFRVVCRYEVAGNVYRKSLPDPRAADWMPAGPALVTDGKGSYTRRGHYDPASPGQLFFPKAFGLGDYLPVFIWSPLFAVGFGGLFLRKPGRSAASPADRAGEGWHRLRPKYSMRYRANGAWGVAVVCNLLLGVAAYDYFTGEPRTRSFMSNALACLALTPGIVASGLAIYYSWMSRRVGEPVVSVDALRLRAGERLAVKVELPLRRDLDVEHVRVSLVCIRSAFENTGSGPGWRERAVYEEHAERSVGQRGRQGTRVSFEQRFRVPADAEPSSLSHAGIRGPWIDWYVEVRLHLDDGPDYRGRFPMTVDAA